MSINFNMQILIVDDSGTMRIMFKQILGKAGFSNLVMAVNGVDGIEKVKAEKPDLVISDWNMPQMDGMEFLQALRAIRASDGPIFPPIPRNIRSPSTSSNILTV